MSDRKPNWVNSSTPGTDPESFAASLWRHKTVSDMTLEEATQRARTPFFGGRSVEDQAAFDRLLTELRDRPVAIVASSNMPAGPVRQAKAGCDYDVIITMPDGEQFSFRGYCSEEYRPREAKR